MKSLVRPGALCGEGLLSRSMEAGEVCDPAEARFEHGSSGAPEGRPGAVDAPCAVRSYAARGPCWLQQGGLRSATSSIWAAAGCETRTVSFAERGESFAASSPLVNHTATGPTSQEILLVRASGSKRRFLICSWKAVTTGVTPPAKPRTWFAVSAMTMVAAHM